MTYQLQYPKKKDNIDSTAECITACPRKSGPGNYQQIWYYIIKCFMKQSSLVYISYSGVEFRFGLRESKLILKFHLLHISMEKLILISGCYENHCENRFSDSRRISSPAYYHTRGGGGHLYFKVDIIRVKKFT